MTFWTVGRSGRATPPLTNVPLAPAERLILRASSVSPHQPPLDGLDGDVDWTRLIELALHHRLAPALLEAVEGASSRSVPADLLDMLRLHVESLNRHTRALIAELQAILDALERLGATAVPFKGPVLGEVLYGSANRRSPGDLDLLVRPDAIACVRRVLIERGYRDAGRPEGQPDLNPVQRQFYEQVHCEYQFARDSDDVVVEPHWALSQSFFALDVDYDGMLNRATTLNLWDRSMRTLAPADLLVALCVHGAKHHWMLLCWIRDIAALLRRFPDVSLESVLSEAQKRGYLRLLLLSLAVAEDHAGAVLPEPVRQRIAADHALPELRAEVRHSLFHPAAEPRNDRIERFRVRLRERPIDRTRYVFRTITTPRRDHLETVSLPSGLGWGYYVIKLGVDFAALPTWQLLKRARFS